MWALSITSPPDFVLYYAHLTSVRCHESLLTNFTYIYIYIYIIYIYIHMYIYICIFNIYDMYDIYDIHFELSFFNSI